MTTHVCHHHHHCDLSPQLPLLCHYHHHYHCHLSPPSPLWSVITTATATTTITTTTTLGIPVVPNQLMCLHGNFSQHLSPSAAHTYNPLQCTYVIKLKFHPFVPVLFMYYNVTDHGVWCNCASGTEQSHLRHTNTKHPATPKISCSRMSLFLKTAIWLSYLTHTLFHNFIKRLVLNVYPTSNLSITKSSWSIPK